jgi:hypothetical protein
MLSQHPMLKVQTDTGRSEQQLLILYLTASLYRLARSDLRSFISTAERTVKSATTQVYA